MRKYIAYLIIFTFSYYNIHAQSITKTGNLIYSNSWRTYLYNGYLLFKTEDCNCPTYLFVDLRSGLFWRNIIHKKAGKNSIELLNNIDNFPYLGINNLYPGFQIAVDYRPDELAAYEGLYFNYNYNPFIPKQPFNYYSIHNILNTNSWHKSAYSFFINDTINNSSSWLSIKSKPTKQPMFSYPDKSNTERRLYENCLAQAPKYFCLACDIINNAEYDGRRYNINPFYKERFNQYWIKNQYSMVYLISKKDSIEEYQYSNINYFPALHRRYYRIKHINKLSPLISQSIKKYSNSRTISLQNIGNVNDDNILITNILDSIGRLKKQTYTLGKDFWTAQVTLTHNYGIDTDTMRHYICYPYRLKGLDTMLAMTAIYQNKRLVSLHHNLLQEHIATDYYSNFFKSSRLSYPVLPINDLTYRVFYNEVGDVKQIIAPHIYFTTRIETSQSYNNAHLDPYDVCILNFEYSDYDSKGNWQTATVIGAKGEGQNEYCGYKEVFKREIIYK